ncbi:Histone-lysine N-methyltransferase SUVR4 [Linum perenne]
MGRERARKAFEATKALGLPHEEVKPVLLELLKSSENNWDFIEADGYRLLLETYFETMDAKVSADMRSGSKDDPVLWKLPKTEQVELPKDQVPAVVVASSSSAAVATPTTLVQTVADETRDMGIRKDHRCYLDDITRGAENVRISLVDDYGGEELPKFFYIRSSIVYRDAKLQISLARISDADFCSSCVGDCVAQPVPCACTSETGGGFAYTRQGVLTDDFLESCLSLTINPQNHPLVFCEDCPLVRIKNESLPSKCSGHLVRKFIKECCIKCGCNWRSCGNRIVQRGITCKLQVFATREGKGWGVRVLQDLPKGAFVCEYAGEILTNTELYERNVHSGGGNGRHTYPVTLDADWGSERALSDDEALCLDATKYGNVARFINHRCHDANLTNIPVEVETPDRHYYHVALFTVREVKAQEELTWDYGIDFDDHDHPIKAFKCLCGSRFCRDKKPKRKLEIVKLDSDSD